MALVKHSGRGVVNKEKTGLHKVTHAGKKIPIIKDAKSKEAEVVKKETAQAAPIANEYKPTAPRKIMGKY